MRVEAVVELEILDKLDVLDVLSVLDALEILDSSLSAAAMTCLVPTLPSTKSTIRSGR